MILKIYTKWDDKLPFECDCIAVGSEKEIDERDRSIEIIYLDFYYIGKQDDGKLCIQERDIKVNDIVKIRGERNKGLVGFLDDAVADCLIGECDDLEMMDGIEIDVQIEND